MPFDYNSFLQGVQTGLRLGRTKLGRIPPPPSDKYIITQDEIPIITDVTAPAPGQGTVKMMDGTEYPIINIDYNTTYNAQNWFAYSADVPGTGGISDLGEYILRTGYRFVYDRDDERGRWDLTFADRQTHIATVSWSDSGLSVPKLYFYYNSSSRYASYPYALLAYVPNDPTYYPDRTSQGPFHWTANDFDEKILYRDPEQNMITE